MVSGATGRTGQALIEDVKTVVIVLMVVFVIGSMIAILGLIGSGLDEGFAQVDAARVYSETAALSGEQRAFTRLTLRNEYTTIAVEGGEATFTADFLDDPLTVDLPGQYTYGAAEFSGKEVCIVKQGTAFSIGSPPCEV